MNTPLKDNDKAVTQTNISWEKIGCPVCDTENFTLLFCKNDEPFVRCDECSLVFINPRPKYDHVLDTYDPEYSHNYAKKKEKKLRRCRRWVKRVKRQFAKTGRWLDIGCSVGFVVMAAEETGFEAYGIDVERWGIDYGRNNLNLKNLSQGSLVEQQYPDRYFNVISLYDVIEHVPDLNELVADLKRILAIDGTIDIITPDLGHWRVPKKLELWGEIKPSEHLYYFNKETLSRLLNKHGLQIVKKRYHSKPSLHVYVQNIK